MVKFSALLVLVYLVSNHVTPAAQRALPEQEGRALLRKSVETMKGLQTLQVESEGTNNTGKAFKQTRYYQFRKDGLIDSRFDRTYWNSNKATWNPDRTFVRNREGLWYVTSNSAVRVPSSEDEKITRPEDYLMSTLLAQDGNTYHLEENAPENRLIVSVTLAEDSKRKLQSLKNARVIPRSEIEKSRNLEVSRVLFHIGREDNLLYAQFSEDAQGLSAPDFQPVRVIANAVLDSNLFALAPNLERIRTTNVPHFVTHMIRGIDQSAGRTLPAVDIFPRMREQMIEKRRRKAVQFMYAVCGATVAAVAFAYFYQKRKRDKEDPAATETGAV
jgi:hypothetical protein